MSGEGPPAGEGEGGRGGFGRGRGRGGRSNSFYASKIAPLSVLTDRFC